MIDRVGIDERRRGFFWGPNHLIRQWAPLLGLDGIGLLVSYDVWCDRREGSATEGYAFPTREQEAAFYGIRKETLGVLTAILEAAGWLKVERVKRPMGGGRGGGGVVYRRKNLYRLVDRDGELTPEDVLNVLRLADKDPRVFRRIRHIFRPDFRPVEGEGNPWATILAQLRDHPLWQKLAARAQAQRADARRRLARQGEEAGGNRSSATRTTGSGGEDNRSSAVRTTGSMGEENRWSAIRTAGFNRSSVSRTTGQPMVREADGKHDDADEAAEGEDEKIFRAFAALTGREGYAPSTRDISALRALQAEGYTTAEILAGIRRAVAGARARGTTPRQFTYCVPAVRDVPPLRRTITADPAPAGGRAAVPAVATPPGPAQATVLAAAPPSDPQRAAAPAAVPSASPASPRAAGQAVPQPSGISPDPLAGTVDVLARFAAGRGLTLDEPTLRDLARLARDFDGVAREQGSAGIEWVRRALRKVDSRVAQPARYVRAILEGWEQEAHDADRQVLAAAPASSEETEGPMKAEPPDPNVALWERALERLRQEMTRATFNSRLAHSRLVDLRREREGVVWVVEVLNRYTQEWLEARLRPVIERVLGQLVPETAKVEFVVSGEGGGGDA